MRISINFGLVKGGAATDLPIRMRISYDGMRLDIRTGFVCPPDKWDADAMRVRSGCSNRYGQTASTINRALAAQSSAIADILARYDIDHKVPDTKLLKHDFEDAMGRKPRGGAASKAASPSFIDVYCRFMREYGLTNSWSHGTFEAYMSVKAHLDDFDFAFAPINDLSQDDLTDFLHSLWQDGIENRTVSAYLTRIRTCLRWAKHQAHIYTGDLYESFHPKLKGLGSKDVKYLEWAEFEKLFAASFDNPGHQAVCDAFCFCCATSLRVSDCSRLKWADVHLDCDAPYIRIVTQKTKAPLTIQLNKYSLALIEKYKNAAGVSPSSMKPVFPPYDLRTRNQYLPIIAKSVGLDRIVRTLQFVGSKVIEQYKPIHEVISTHFGRHTFIVHALRLGIEPTVIMSWTGHASYESMRPYIAIVQEAKVEKMALFDK